MNKNEWPPLKKVSLFSDELKETKEFGVEHAERILALNARAGYNVWVLKDENYTLEDGKIIASANPGANKDSKE